MAKATQSASHVSRKSRVWSSWSSQMRRRTGECEWLFDAVDGLPPFAFIRTLAFFFEWQFTTNCVFELFDRKPMILSRWIASSFSSPIRSFIYGQFKLRVATEIFLISRIYELQKINKLLLTNIFIHFHLWFHRGIVSWLKRVRLYRMHNCIRRMWAARWKFWLWTYIYF